MGCMHGKTNSSRPVVEKKMHINCLEIEAVFNTIFHFLPQLENHNILIRSDNITVVQYLNKQGGTHSAVLCMKTWKIWQQHVFKSSSHIGKVECSSRSIIKTPNQTNRMDSESICCQSNNSEVGVSFDRPVCFSFE